MSNKPVLPISVITAQEALVKYGNELVEQLIVVIESPSVNADDYKPGMYHVDNVLQEDGQITGINGTHLVTGETMFIDEDDLLLVGIELPVDGDNSNLANVQSNKTLAEALDKSATWHSEAEGTVKEMVTAVLDEEATTVNLCDGVSVDLQVKGVREQLGSVLGIVSGLFSSSPLREMP